ncbi:hypothetical protein J14TS5_50660 [Paenibacillus lautus]|nr:hypothetical protein J14TS5_50660 [Paenibacillus lautus]
MNRPAFDRGQGGCFALRKHNGLTEHARFRKSRNAAKKYLSVTKCVVTPKKFQEVRTQAKNVTNAKTETYREKQK